MYTKTECEILDKKEICKYYSGRYGAPGMPRAKKHKKTSEEIAKQNLWIRMRDLRRLIELNFAEGDWHVVLTCRKEERPGKEDAPDVIRGFRDLLRDAYKKEGWNLKYIITCETGSRGAVHWHMIVNNMHNDRTSTAKMIKGLWTRGRPYFSPLDAGGDYKTLAEYIVKETAKRVEQENTLEKLSYMPSRNLIRPEVKKKEIRATRWRKEPVAPEGYYVVPDSIVNGINKFTGFPYQHYTIRRLAEDGRDKYLHRDNKQGAKDTNGCVSVSGRKKKQRRGARNGRGILLPDGERKQDGINSPGKSIGTG